MRLSLEVLPSRRDQLNSVHRKLLDHTEAISPSPTPHWPTHLSWMTIVEDSVIEELPLQHPDTCVQQLRLLGALHTAAPQVATRIGATEAEGGHATDATLHPVVRELLGAPGSLAFTPGSQSKRSPAPLCHHQKKKGKINLSNSLWVKQQLKTLCLT